MAEAPARIARRAILRARRLQALRRLRWERAVVRAAEREARKAVYHR